MRADDEGVLEVAAAVADGAAVDWVAAEGKVEDGGQRAVVRQLKILSDAAGILGGIGGASADDDLEATTSNGRIQAMSDSRIPERWNHLEIRERVGGGAFGQVYRAWDPKLEREVALKLLRASRSTPNERISRVLTEGRLLARLRHPNVVTIHGVEIVDGSLGMWMELIQGKTLDELVKSHGPLGAREAALIGADLCRALAAVHAAGLVHRDVKAQNVMREERGRIVLMDFGTVVERSDDSTGGKLTGTPIYMAPEVFRGDPITPRSDLYGLGVLLYFLVTSSFPVEARSLREMAEAHAGRRVKLLRDVRADLPEAFVQVVERALASDPGQRFGSAGEMERALLASLGTLEQPSVSSGSSDVGASRLGTRTLTLVILPVLIVVGVGLWLRGFSLHRTNTPYTVEAAMYRTRDGNRERVEPGMETSPGDGLSLDLKGSTDLYVYVLNEDDHGKSYLLFPLSNVEPKNPLAAGTTHRLPGTSPNGKPLSWKVTTSAGGQEHFLVVASPEPLKDLEAELATLPQPRPGEPVQYTAVSQVAKDRLRGVGGLTDEADAESVSGSGLLFERVGRLAGRAEDARGVWIRRIDLENPGP